MTRTATSPKIKPKAAPASPPKRKETTRDLVEQIVVAFILAFLIRGFEAEAFVIPTGSMAPTLYGQHKEVTCPQCGQVFAVNAADEAEPRHLQFDANNPNAPGRIPQVDSATCLNCRYRVTKLAETPSFKGDRILVMKFLYNLPTWLGGRLPSRWDVIVFHFPEEPETNYIKRLIGLPGEVIRIFHGDVLTKKLGSNDAFEIARKPLSQQQAMMQLVWNDANRPKAFTDHPEWNRWSPSKKDGWSEASSGVFKSAKSDDWNTLGYRHLVPEPKQWDAALTGKPIPGAPRPILISDFYGYNSGANNDERPETAAWFNPHWVGDLAVSSRIKAESGSGGEIRFDLVEGGIVHRCTVDLKTGDAILSRNGKAIGELASTSLRDDGRAHEVTFANVDDRLTLWVDGKTPFGDGVPYATSPETVSPPTAADLAPATISTKGGSVEVSGLVLKRDIYYTQDPRRGSDYEGHGVPWTNQGSDPHVFAESFDFLSDPAKFEAFGDVKWHDYEIKPGRYMMMGDNSPRSSDSRAWGHQDSLGYSDRRNRGWIERWSEPDQRSSWEVPENLIIGKAFFIYWPHGVPFWPGVPVSRDFRIPFRPYVERMTWIR